MIVKYSKKFATAPFLNEDIGFEYECDLGINQKDAVLEIVGKLKAMAEKFHKDNNPQITDEVKLYSSNLEWGPLKTKENAALIPTIDPRAYETAEIGIDNATTIQDLEWYADIAVKYGLVEMYLNKKKSLQ